MSKRARLIHLSDLHLMENARFDIAAGVLMRLANHFEDVHKRDALDGFLITGDLSGRDAPHHSTPAERTILATFFRRLSRLAPVVIIRGNHDRLGELVLYERCAENHSILTDEEWGYYFLPNKIGVFTLPWAPLRSFGHDLGGIDREKANETVLNRIMARWKEFVNGRPDHTVHVLAAHFPVRNASVGSFEIQSSRDVLITREWLEQTGADYVALGHVHQAQRVADNAWYAGSPYPVDFSETFPHSYNLIEIDEYGTHVYVMPIESWRMVTLWGSYRDSNVHNPLIDLCTKKQLGREELDDAHVRIMLDLDPHTPMESLPLDAIQNAILMSGGTLDRKDIHFKRIAPQVASIAVAQDGQVQWTLYERLQNHVRESVDDPSRRQRLLDLAASIA